jgi:hypothetical protein
LDTVASPQTAATTNDSTTTPTGSSTTNNSNLTTQINNAQMALLQDLAGYNVANQGNQQATSGNVNGSDSASLGNATSGNALAISNYLNLLDSMWSWSTTGLSTFVQNLFGNQTGNINLDPTTANNSNVSSQANNTANLTVDNSPSANITNNITTGANSGNVNLNDNATAGNATSGDAAAEVNLINLIDSSIGAGQSFFGMLNIFGNLNGNILFPAGFLNAATPGTSTSNTTNDATVTNAPSVNVSNNINGQATSGAVTAGDNAVTGNATSGNAATDSSLYNLINTNVTATNAVLVLVNVMGQWLGGIMNLPSTGNTGSALLTNNGQATQDANTTNTADITNAPTGTITNNVTATAQTGDVTATDNAKVGNLTSGNATVSTGVANLFGSTLNVSNWFGILVINVFGDWTGSVDTATATTPAPQATTTTITAQAVDPTTARQFIATISHDLAVTSGGTSTPTETPTSGILLANANSGLAPVPTVTAQSTKQANDTGLLFEIAAGMLLIAGAIGAADRRRQQR